MLKLKKALVSANWLKEHLDAPNLVVLDASIPKVVGNTSELSDKQIPQARFFDIKNHFSDVSGRFPNTFPSAMQFEQSAQSLGINTDSIIVVYDDKGIYSSARVWWLFKTFGHNNVAVLDGGLPEWITSGFDLEQKQKRHVNKGNFEANTMASNMCFFDDIVNISSSKTAHILDARSEGRFKGLVSEPRKNLRSGTIPDSKNLPYDMLLIDGKMKDKTELQRMFASFGNKDDAFVFSCGSGITACVLALGADLADYNNLTVYDGSWTEYGSLTKD